MCYCGFLSFIGLLQVVASVILLASVYIQYDICYVSNTVYSLIWIQTLLSVVLYVLHCIPGLYMMLKAMKVKLLLFTSQMILTIITTLMVDFNDLTRLTCDSRIYDTMIYASLAVAITAFLSAIYVLYQEPKTPESSNRQKTYDTEEQV